MLIFAYHRIVDTINESSEMCSCQTLTPITIIMYVSCMRVNIGNIKTTIVSAFSSRVPYTTGYLFIIYIITEFTIVCTIWLKSATFKYFQSPHGNCCRVGNAYVPLRYARHWLTGIKNRKYFPNI